MNIIVTDRDGREHVLEALEGWRVMEVIRDWGIPIKAECGGAGVCGTCHVEVAADWRERLPEPGDEELDALDKIAGATDGSRLCCQILTAEALDGLRVSLTPEAGCGTGETREAEAA